MTTTKTIKTTTTEDLRAEQDSLAACLCELPVSSPLWESIYGRYSSILDELCRRNGTLRSLLDQAQG